LDGSLGDSRIIRFLNRKLPPPSRKIYRQFKFRSPNLGSYGRRYIHNELSRTNVSCLRLHCSTPGARPKRQRCHVRHGNCPTTEDSHHLNLAKRAQMKLAFLAVLMLVAYDRPADHLRRVGSIWVDQRSWLSTSLSVTVITSVAPSIATCPKNCMAARRKATLRTIPAKAGSARTIGRWVATSSGRSVQVIFRGGRRIAHRRLVLKQ
jgi:hypothetical protein